MKVACVLLAFVVVGALAQEDPTIAPFTCDGNAFVCKLKELGHHIKFHASKLGNRLKDVGTSILSSALDQGKSLLASGSQAVLGTVLEHLNKSGVVGKRDLTFFDKLKAHFANGVGFLTKVKEGLKAHFEKAVSKITGVMSDTASLKKVEGDADKKVDDAVEEFKKEGGSGFAKMASFVKSKLKDIFNAGMDRLKALAAKKADTTEKRAILDTIKGLWEKAKGHFSTVVGGLSDTFRPHLDALKTGLGALASKAKEHASKLVETAKGHFTALTGKLGGHIDQLKEHAGTLGTHAKNALSALKEAVSSIVSQTVSNTKDTVANVIGTVKDGAGVVKDHFTGSN